MSTFKIENKTYTVGDFNNYLKELPDVEIDSEAQKTITRSRDYLEQKMREPDSVIYGVNTGFGRLANVRIAAADLLVLQRNLILSHAVGVGAPLPPHVVRLTMLLKLISFARGASGVRLEVALMLARFLSDDILPVIPSQGSVGASGDLAPLAHMTLPMMGEGNVMHRGMLRPITEIFDKFSMAPLVLQAKEGLALINGTQVSTAIGLTAVMRLENLMKAADVIGALTVEGLLGSPTPFRPEVHALKTHAGSRTVAHNLRSLMAGSTLRESHRQDDDRVQDPYSLRCMPQIHGACRDAIDYAVTALIGEANSVSDNPLVLVAEDEIISAGHFHGEMVAMAADFASIAAAELGSVSERRIFALLAGQSGLPPFLVVKPGLNSGFMMLQVSAASLVSENKTLAHPAVVDSIPTGADQEDHVPMSTWAARKLSQITDNLENILAIEYLAASQAVDLREGLSGGDGAMAAHALLREQVDPLEQDRALSGDLSAARELLSTGALVQAVEKVVPLS
ncbi:MAG: histidine ammonia-lyase [Candidatus Marinimicrobia bacterium]|nr:histidine ammonia-lyase [Candidatus Neomarinimicrobiota bacterium]